MKKSLHNKPVSILLIVLLALIQSAFAQFPGVPGSYARQEVSSQKVQLALILDASGSMNRYLDQAKGELWYTVNEVLAAYEGYATPRLEISIMVYGLKEAGRRNDFVQMVVPFTTDLDWAVDELYKIHTGGRVERPIKALEQAINQLDWSNRTGDLKFLFIAGNETFTRSARKFTQLGQARTRDISVNTIFGGSYRKGIKKLWKAAADYGQGEYFALKNAPKQRWQHAAHDREYIARMNRNLYDTYIPYGRYGNSSWDRYCYLDDYAWGYGYDAYYWRTYYKTRVNYYNPQWDLVDAIACGYTTWDDIPVGDLPPDIRDMTPPQRDDYIEDLWNRRQKILTEIRGHGSAVAPQATLNSPSNGTVGGLHQAVDKTVRKKVENSRGILLTPADVKPGYIPGVGTPGDDRSVGRRISSPQPPAGTGISNQTTVERRSRSDAATIPSPTGRQQVQQTVKPEREATTPINKNINSRKPEINRAPQQATSQQGTTSPVIKPVTKQVQVKQMQASEQAQMEKARKTQIAEEAAADAARDREIDRLREQEKVKQVNREREIEDARAAERAREVQLEREREAHEERARIERERESRIQAEQAAERAREVQLNREREAREERARIDRERESRIQAEQAAERAREVQLSREREAREERARMERERESRIQAERAREAQQSRERQERMQQQQAHERAARVQAQQQAQQKAQQQAREAAKKQQVQRKVESSKPAPSKTINKSSVNKGGGSVGKIKN